MHIQPETFYKQAQKSPLEHDGGSTYEVKRGSLSANAQKEAHIEVSDKIFNSQDQASKNISMKAYEL